jgi:hypothetical protein
MPEGSGVFFHDLLSRASPMSKRIIASLVHLGISILLVSCVLAAVVLVWYPGLYFQAMGVGPMLLILASVDVTIGPLITLIIFNPAKKSLRFDLAVIALLQLMALGYGVYTVFLGRPVYMVFNIDRFTIVAAADILPDDLKKAREPSLPLWGPQIVGARLPDDAGERDRMLTSSLHGGADLPQMPQFYLPYLAVASDVKSHMLSFEALSKRLPKSNVAQAQALMAEMVSKNGLRVEELGFVPVSAKKQDMTMLVRRSDASIVGMLPIVPWIQ